MIGAETLGKTQTQTQTRDSRAGNKNRESRVENQDRDQDQKLGQGQIRGDWSKVKPEFRVRVRTYSLIHCR